MAERILAVQAQDGVGARLAIRARSNALSAAAVDRALNEGLLVISWLNRGTLHLVRREDYPWLHALTVPRLSKANQTRLRQEGVSAGQAERGAKVVVKALADGPMSRDDLREVLDGAGVPTAGQALVHVLLFTTIGGSILRGPVVGNEQQFVLVEDWLGPQDAVDPEVALAELARRYLRGHGPATDRDLAKWAGITLGQARKGLKAIGTEVTELGDEVLELTDQPEPADAGLPTRLLGAFDPILHGWTSREFLIPSEKDRAVVTTNGIFRPTILVDGQVAGVWRRPGGKVELDPFEALDDDVARELKADGEGVIDFLG